MQKIIGCLFLTTVLALSAAHAGEVKFTTYYPSPFGEYEQTITQTLGVGDTNNDGEFNAEDAPDLDNNMGNIWVRGQIGVGIFDPDTPILEESETGVTISGPAVALAFHETGRAIDDGGLWRMPVDGGALRFDMNTSDAPPYFQTWDTPFIIRPTGAVSIGTTEERDGALTIMDTAVPLVLHENGQALTNGGLWRMPLDSGILRFDVNTNAAGTFDPVVNVLLMRPNGAVEVPGRMGIGTTNPTAALHTVGSGARTASYTGNLLTNIATSSTASITKSGVEIQSTGTWNGTSANNVGLNISSVSGGINNYGLYVRSVTGGTNNYDAIFNGGGNVGIGTTTPSTMLNIKNQGTSPNTLYETLRLQAGSEGPNSGTYIQFQNKAVTDMGRVAGVDSGGWGGCLAFYTKTAGGSGQATWVSTERMRIDNNGNVGIGTITPGSGGYTNVLAIANASNHPASFSGVSQLYTYGGEGYWTDSAGNRTQQTPHDPATGEWIFFSKNINTGKVVRVNMEQLVKEVERLSGKKFLFETMEREE